MVYDDNGLASARAVNVLRGLAFEKVVNLKGGIGAWARENFPLETGKKAGAKGSPKKGKTKGK